MNTTPQHLFAAVFACLTGAASLVIGILVAVQIDAWEVAGLAGFVFASALGVLVGLLGLLALFPLTLPALLVLSLVVWLPLSAAQTSLPGRMPR